MEGIFKVKVYKRSNVSQDWTITETADQVYTSAWLTNVKNVDRKSNIRLGDGVSIDVTQYPDVVKMIFDIYFINASAFSLHPPDWTPPDDATGEFYALSDELPMFHYDAFVWYIGANGFPTNENIRDEAEYTEPIPLSQWHIQSGYNNGFPYNELIPNVSYNPPPPEYETVTILQYDIYCDDKLMHSSVVPENEYKVIDPVLDLQDSAAGSLEFSLPPFNCMYGKCQMMMSTIRVERNGKEIWEGRPVSFKEDMWLNHPITCEGELAYLNDIYQVQAKYENVTLEQLIYGIIGVTDGHIDTSKGYNARAAANRRFNVTSIASAKYGDDTLLTITIPFQSTLETINSICKTYGLHVYMDNRWDENGVKTRGICFRDDSGLGQNPTQKIEFGTNLVDYAKSYNFAQLVTAVLPLGAKSDKAGSVVKDTDESANAKAAGLEQGTIWESGDHDDTTRVRSSSYLTIPSGADTLKVTAEMASGTANVAIVAYSDKETQISGFDTDWHNSGYSWQIGSFSSAKFYRVIIRYLNDAAITPSNVESCMVEISKTRKGIPYGTSGYGRSYVIWPSDKKDSHGDMHYAGDIVYLTDDITDFGIEQSRYFVNQYKISEENATVFITTQMKSGAGMIVVYNNGQKYFLKKSSKSDNMTVWTELKFNGWYKGFEGDVYMYVAGYDSTSDSGVTHGLTVVNSKVVDKSLEDYITVDGVESPNIQGLFVIDTDPTQYTDGVLPSETYGRIERKMEWPDAKDAWTLYNNALTYLRSTQFDGLEIELSALDMSMLGIKASQLRVGEWVSCKCQPYGLDKVMPVSEIKIPLNKPEDAKYKVGDKRKQSLTSVNNATNTDILSLIAEKPSMSSVLAAAKTSTAEYLKDTQNGYITDIYAEDGHREAMIISDTEDYRQTSKGYWILGKHGIGFVPIDGSPDSPLVAMTDEGKVVADMITTGTMSADRIFGDTLKLGLLGTQSGNMVVYDGNQNSVIARIDSNGIMQQEAPSSDPNDKFSRIEMHDGKLEFTRVNSQAPSIFIKGDGVIEGYEDDATIEIYSGSGNEPNMNSILGIAVGTIAIIGSDGYAFGKSGTVYAANKELYFNKGILTSIENSSSTLASGTFISGGSNPKRIVVSNGLITAIDDSNNE
jgi:hypothetical protein